MIQLWFLPMKVSLSHLKSLRSFSRANMNLKEPQNLKMVDKILSINLNKILVMPDDHIIWFILCNFIQEDFPQWDSRKWGKNAYALFLTLSNKYRRSIAVDDPFHITIFATDISLLLLLLFCVIVFDSVWMIVAIMESSIPRSSSVKSNDDLNSAARLLNTWQFEVRLLRLYIIKTLESRWTNQ